MNKIGYHINPHENGWAVMAGGVIQGVYPRKHMAKASIEDGTENQSLTTAREEFRLRRSRDRLRSSGQDGRQHVIVPDDVSLPLSDQVSEVRVPVDISGRNLATGKL